MVYPVRQQLLLPAFVSAALLAAGCSRSEPDAAKSGSSAKASEASASAYSAPPAQPGTPKPPYEGELNYQKALEHGQSMSPSQWLKVLEVTSKPEEKEEIVRMSVTYSPEAAPGVLKQAIADPDPRIRLSAVIAAGEVFRAQPMTEVLNAGLTDADESIRQTSFDFIRSLDPETRLSLLGPMLKQIKYRDTLDASIQEIAGLHRKDAFELLVTTGQEMEAVWQTRIADTLGLVVQRKFPDFAAAGKWWGTAKNKFDDGLALVNRDDPPPP